MTYRDLLFRFLGNAQVRKFVTTSVEVQCKDCCSRIFARPYGHLKYYSRDDFKKVICTACGGHATHRVVVMMHAVFDWPKMPFKDDDP